MIITIAVYQTACQYLFYLQPMLDSKPKIFVICLALMATTVLAEFRYNRTLDMKNVQPLDAQFTPDSKYLILLASTSIQVFSSDTGKALYNITLSSEGRTITVGQLPSGTQLLAVGQKSGRITVFDVKTGQFAANPIEDTQSPITSICFNSNSQMLVVAYQNHTVRAYDWTNDHNFDISRTLSGEPGVDIRVACSSQNPIQFVASWAAFNTTEGATISILTVSREQSEIDLIGQVHSAQLNQIMDIHPTTDGDFLFVADSPFIYTLNITSSEITVFQYLQGTGPYHKINFDKNIGNLAIINDTHLVLLVQEPQFVPQYFESDKNIIAMSPLGGQIFFIPTGSDSAQLTQQCVEETFYINGQCEACREAQCSRCVSGEQCGLCKSSYFLLNDLCEVCLARCELCYESTTCQKCFQPFIKIDNNLCTCPAGQFVNGLTCSVCPKQCKSCTALDQCTSCNNSYYLKNGICGQGPTFGIFIAIIGASGVVMLGIIAFNVCRISDSRKKRNLLEDDLQKDDEGED